MSEFPNSISDSDTVNDVFDPFSDIDLPFVEGICSTPVKKLKTRTRNVKVVWPHGQLGGYPMRKSMNYIL